MRRFLVAAYAFCKTPCGGLLVWTLVYLLAAAISFYPSYKIVRIQFSPTEEKALWGFTLLLAFVIPAVLTLVIFTFMFVVQVVIWIYQCSKKSIRDVRARLAQYDGLEIDYY